MNLLLALLTLLASATVLGVSGYAVVGWFRSVTPARRLLAAPAIGLAWLLWSASVINAVMPLRGAAPHLAWAAVALVLLVPSLRRVAWADLMLAAADRRVQAIALGAAVVVLLLLYPLFAHEDVLFFDGTGNHDNFFWIVGAEYLQSHTYLRWIEPPDQPIVFAHIGSILGLIPPWGRMGAEGYVATLAGMFQAEPLRVYLGIVAALLLPWLGAAFGLARAIGWPLRAWPVLAGAAALQPLFVFFVTNGNLPNLCGTICGGALLVATFEATDGGRAGRWFGLCQIPWLLHGVLVSYPEVAPFVGLPAAAWVVWRVVRPADAISRPRLMLTIGGAVVAGLLLNPITTWRAIHGFAASFASARADGGWPNIFAGVSPFNHLPATLTLATEAATRQHAAVGAVASLLVLVAVGLALQTARQRLLALVSLLGFAALGAYTLLTDFSYGWQKTAQFAAIPLVALYPMGVLSLAAAAMRRPRLWLVLPLAACVPAAYGLWVMARTAHRFAEEKAITVPMLEMAARVKQLEPHRPILVEVESFRMPYFHSMWAAYLLGGERVRYPRGAADAGGYLQDRIMHFDPASPPADALGTYVSRDWADAFSTDLPRLEENRLVALLPETNEVQQLEGFYPAYGVPGPKGVPLSATPAFSLTLRPLRPGTLRLVLQAHAQSGRDWTAEVARTATGAPAEREWQARVGTTDDGVLELHVPLIGKSSNQVTVRLQSPRGSPAATREYPFAVRELELRGLTPAQSTSSAPSVVPLPPHGD